jgi:16S rRNA (adenine1518-N6/adenine1519-N6)-dimethyltransferase
VEIKDALIKHNFKFKKSLGQNFITDTNLLAAIVADAGVLADDTVIEIGAGAGALTKELAKVAKRVLAFDVDNSLQPVLQDTLGGFSNIELHFKDVLNLTDDEILSLAGGAFKVVANLPYYITTPMIMRFVESNLPVTSLTVMVQKEVAERLSAKPNTKEYGAITLAVKARGDAKITRGVTRKLFYPVPNVDSAVVHIDINRQKSLGDKKTLLKLIKAGFFMRRKTLANNIADVFKIEKQQVIKILTDLNYPESIRGEALGLEDYIKIAQKLKTEN